VKVFKVVRTRIFYLPFESAQDGQVSKPEQNASAVLSHSKGGSASSRLPTEVIAPFAQREMLVG
jgi:hypothetical protein